MIRITMRPIRGFVQYIKLGNTKIFQQLTLRDFSSYGKIISTIMTTGKTLPKLSDVEKKSINLTSVIGFPFGIHIVKPNHILTYYSFGKYGGYRTSGLTWIPPFYTMYNETFCGEIILTNNFYLYDNNPFFNKININSSITYNIVNPVNNFINLPSEEVLSNWLKNIIQVEISKYNLSDSMEEKILNEFVKKINSDAGAKIYGIEVQRIRLEKIKVDNKCEEQKSIIQFTNDIQPQPQLQYECNQEYEYQYECNQEYQYYKPEQTKLLRHEKKCNDDLIEHVGLARFIFSISGLSCLLIILGNINPLFFDNFIFPMLLLKLTIVPLSIDIAFKVIITIGVFTILCFHLRAIY